MADTESYTVATPQLPMRRPWPISLWIIPDLLLGFVLTLVLTVPVIAISLFFRWYTGDLLFEPGGVLRLANGEVIYGLGSSNEAFTKAVNTPGVLFGATLLQNLAFATIVYLRVRVLRKLPWEWLGLQFRNFGRLVLFGIGLGVAFLVLNILSGLFFSQFLGIEQNQSDQFPLSADDLTGQLLLFLLAAVVAPLGEELLFRGYLFHAIRQDLGVAAAFVLTALVFSLVHYFGVTEGAPALLIPLFFGGLLLAWGTQRSSSLVPGIIAHAINNGVAMGLLLTCVNNPGLCLAT